MLISHNWLREWVRPRVSIGELSERLTLGGLEVTAVETAGPALGKRVIIGRVAGVAAHPGRAAPANLRVCEVEVGRRANLTIVCGAANLAPGDKVAVAMPGAKLPGLAATTAMATVQRRRIGGLESAGMLCSAAELGLDENSDGVLQLDADAPVGRPLGDYLDLADRVLELELTPNRGDCLSVLGVAREVSALTGARLTTPPGLTDKIRATDRMKLPVELRAPRGCPRYAGRAVRGVNLSARAPNWLTERLRRSGARSVNVAVDVTNYVMLELGQPMHAFDLHKLSGGIVVRQAKAGEKLRLLDGRRLTLNADNLVIADHKKAVALAGIMGGWDSAISGATRDIYFEAALFPAPAMLGQARQFGLHTDASHRFERGVDPSMQAAAMERATQLLVAIAGGEAGPITDARARKFMPKPVTVELPRAEIPRLLGMAVPARQVGAILKRLGLRATATGDGWRVGVPSWRSDITGAHDLVEEVARVYGYDKIPPRPPAAVAGATVTGARPETGVELSRLKNALVARGYFEAITYSFVDPQVQRDLLGKRGLALRNPIAANLSVMRRSLWPGLLDALRGNLNRRHERARLFEAGHVFLGKRGDGGDGGYEEVHKLAAVATGPAQPKQWGEAERAVDFFDLKGDLLALLALTGAPERDWIYQSAAHPALHPGRSAQVRAGGRGGKIIGHLGQLHPAHQQSLDLAQAVYLFEIEVAAVSRARLPAFAPMSRYPAARRDLAVVVAAGVAAQEVLDAARAAAGPQLVDLALFDIYAGERLEKNRKSFAFRLTFQAKSRNLTAAEVDAQTERIVAALRRRFGARLRT